MLEKINVRGFNEFSKVKERAAEILELYKNCITEIKSKYENLQFTISGSEPFCEIFIKGNKDVGCDYDMTMWKTVPCLRIESHRFSEEHPNTPNLYFLYVGYNYSGSNSSEDWCKGEEDANRQIMKGLENAVKDFTVQKCNQL